MSWWKNKKCKTCRKKIVGESAELRVDTANGIMVLEVCDECADFFDKSADILRNKDDGHDEGSHS